jgi:hypothetical protein
VRRLFSFAFSPAATMARTEHSHRAILILVPLAFLSTVLRSADGRAMRLAIQEIGVAKSLAYAGAFALVFSVVCIALFYVFAWIAKTAGQWLGGNAAIDRVRVALAWGFAPLILALVYRVPALIFWPEAVAAAGGADSGEFSLGDPNVGLNIPTLQAPLYQIAILGLLHLAFLIWYLLVASQALAEAQSFSPWRGLANLMLAFVMPVVVIFVLGLALFLTYRNG